MFELNAHVVRLDGKEDPQVIVVTVLDGGVQFVVRGAEGALITWALLSRDESVELGRALLALMGAGEAD